MGVRFIALEPTLSADRDVAEGSVADIAASRWQGGRFCHQLPASRASAPVRSRAAKTQIWVPIRVSFGGSTTQGRMMCRKKNQQMRAST